MYRLNTNYERSRTSLSIKPFNFNVKIYGTADSLPLTRLGSVTVIK